MEFLLGSAAIVSPAGQLPFFAAYCGTKLIKCIARRRQEENKEQIHSTTGVTIQWHDIRLKLEQKTSYGYITRHILDGVSGAAYPGRLLAVMGPSAAGKTSLLNALARQVPFSTKMSFHGKIEINGVDVKTDDAIRQAYIQQEDLFYSQLTLRETLTMACSLRLPADLDPIERDRLVNALIEKLGLTACADTYVGDATTRGLSGGEKKRLSIGCELINSPALMFLDEPTTGLDAFQSEKVIQALKRLTEEGHTIICTIHQPRSSIFAMFDDLVLLAQGKVVYSGMAGTAINYFASRGYQCPEHYNPAEYFADLISIDTSSPETAESSKQRLFSLTAMWETASKETYQVQSSNRKQFKLSTSLSASGRSNWRRDFRLLLGRSWKQARRDKKTNVARLMMNVGSACIFGGIYFKTKLVASAVQDRVGLLQLSAINTAMSSLVKTLNVFPSEQTIVTRERAKKAYGVLPYLCAKILSDVPVGVLLSCTFGTMLYSLAGLNPSKGRAATFMGIVVVESFASAALGLSVGSVAPSTDVAVALGPMVMLLFIVFGGQFKNTDSTTPILKWVPNASLIQNGFQAMCINEFSEMEFESDPEHEGRSMMQDGNAVLRWLGFDNIPVRKPILRNARVILFNYWFTYNVLKAKKPKFTPLLDPEILQTDSKEKC